LSILWFLLLRILGFVVVVVVFVDHQDFFDDLFSKFGMHGCEATTMTFIIAAWLYQKGTAIVPASMATPQQQGRNDRWEDESDHTFDSGRRTRSASYSSTPYD
jgi:hypothetical protein